MQKEYILQRIYGLIGAPDTQPVKEFLDELAVEEQDSLNRAGIYYLIHNVWPTMVGVEPKPLPRWVFNQLFAESTDAPTTAVEFLDLHPGSAVIAFDERERGLRVRYPLREDLGEEDLERARDASYGLFFSPNRVSKGEHLDKDVVEFRYFFLDFDGGNKPDQMRRIAELPFEPTFLVDSCNGLHAYYRLAKNEIAPEVWSGIEARLIAHCGADPKACNPARVLRLPFTWHTKGEPYLVTIKSWSNRMYNWQQFAEMFPEPKKQVFQLSAPNYKPSIKAAPVGMLTKNNRHAGLEDYLKAAYFRIREDRSLCSELRAYTKGWYEHGHTPQKRNWEQEVDDLCDWFEVNQWGMVVSR